MNGVFWVLGGPLEGVPNNPTPARVINLSVGGPVDAAAQSIWDAFFNDPDGILQDPFYGDPVVVAAVGNDDIDASSVAPANVSGIIAVGAVRSIDGLRAPYSNFGPVIDLMAPGGDDSLDLTQDGSGDGILSTYANDYDFEQGTSMAAPVVAGVAALLLSQNPTLTRAQVESILKTSANPDGLCTEGCGDGWLDAYAALLLAGGVIEDLPRLAVDTSQVLFGDGIALRTVHVLNTGNVEFNFTATIDGAQADLFSLDVASGTVPPAGADSSGVPIVIALTRNGFESGTANLNIRTVGLFDDQGMAADQVQRVDIQFNDDPNRVPRLVDIIQVAAYVEQDGALKSVAKTTTTREEQFRYQIDGVPGGSYFVFAVADDNRDGTFDPDSETRGGYPVARAPELVVVPDDKKVEFIDFFVQPVFVSGVLGAVGAPCDSDGDCTFAPDAECIVSFEGG
jgi:serine protease